MTIAENVLAGLKFSRISPADKDDLIEESLTKAGLWNEVQGPARASSAGRSPAASSSACASPGRWPSSPGCC